VRTLDKSEIDLAGIMSHHLRVDGSMEIERCSSEIYLSHMMPLDPSSKSALTFASNTAFAMGSMPQEIPELDALLVGAGFGSFTLLNK
jgi:hypothetical protein